MDRVRFGVLKGLGRKWLVHYRNEQVISCGTANEITGKAVHKPVVGDTCPQIGLLSLTKTITHMKQMPLITFLPANGCFLMAGERGWLTSLLSDTIVSGCCFCLVRRKRTLHGFQNLLSPARVSEHTKHIVISTPT